MADLYRFKLLRTDFILYMAVFLFFFSLIFNSMFGTYSALIFIFCGSLIIINNINESCIIMLKYKVLLAIPFFAILSTLWSDTPLLALRGGVQLLLTTIFSVVLICRVEKKVLLNTLAFAFLLAMISSLASNRFAINGMTGEFSLIGIFSSKNYLATHTALSVGVAVCLYFDKCNKKSSFLGGILLLLSILVLIKAKSFGAVLSVALSLFCMYLFIWYQNKKITLNFRKTINFFIVINFILIIVVAIYSLTESYFDEFMYSIGKDPTLTGRVYIWERGIELISSNPILGAGYQSVFVLNNVIAEDIWEYAKVESGAGFNFHNMFINIWVELGVVGFFLYMVGLCFMIRKLFKTYVFKEPFIILSTFVFFFFFIQSFLEAVLLRQFTIAQFLVCFTWITFESVTRRNVNVT